MTDREHVINVPGHVRNPDDYFDRTIQHWHMRVMPSNHSAIDLDLMGYCDAAGCRQPLYLIEATSNAENKATSVLAALARSANVPALLLVHANGEFSKWKRVGGRSDWHDEARCIAYLTLIRRAHDAVFHLPPPAAPV